MTTNEKIVDVVTEGLTANDGEQEAGQCWRFIRLRLKKRFGHRFPCPPIGSDAAQAMMWYTLAGYALPQGAQTLPGDLYFWIGDRHGPHGHVACRILGNRIAENSFLHWTKRRPDARGTRPLKGLTPPTCVVRLKLLNE